MIRCKVRNRPWERNLFVLQKQQNQGRRFGTSKVHWSPPPPVTLATVRSKAVVLLLIRCWLLLLLWDSVIVLCLAVCYIVSILVLRSSLWGRESWLLCFVCLPGVLWLVCDFLSIPWVCLQIVIVVFPNHTHFLFLKPGLIIISMNSNKTKWLYIWGLG